MKFICFLCPHKERNWEWHCQKRSLIITTTWWRRSAYGHLSRDDSRGSAEEHTFYEPGWYFYADATWHAVHGEGSPRTIKLCGYSCNLQFVHAAISESMSYSLCLKHEDKPVCSFKTGSWILGNFTSIMRNDPIALSMNLILICDMRLHLSVDKSWLVTNDSQFNPNPLIIREAPSDAYKWCRCLIVQIHNKKKSSLVHALISFWRRYTNLLFCGINTTSLSLVMLEDFAPDTGE